MKEEQLFERIEQYLAGELSPQDASQMEKDMQADQSLRDAVAKQQMAHEAMEVMIENNLRSSFAEWDEEGEAKVVTISRGAKMRTLYRRMAAAMSILLVVGFGLSWMLSNSYSNEGLAASYYELPIDSEDRGGTTSASSISEGLNAFFNQDYIKAIDLLATVPSNDERFVEAQFYLGHAFSERGDEGAALQAFQQVVDGNDDRFKEKGEWNLLLKKLELGLGDPEFISLLVTIADDEGHSYHEQAKALQSDLNSTIRNIFH